MLPLTFAKMAPTSTETEPAWATNSALVEVVTAAEALSRGPKVFMIVTATAAIAVTSINDREPGLSQIIDPEASSPAFAKSEGEAHTDVGARSSLVWGSPYKRVTCTRLLLHSSLDVGVSPCPL